MAEDDDWGADIGPATPNGGRKSDVIFAVRELTRVTKDIKRIMERHDDMLHTHDKGLDMLKNDMEKGTQRSVEHLEDHEERMRLLEGRLPPLGYFENLTKKIEALEEHKNTLNGGAKAWQVVLGVILSIIGGVVTAAVVSNSVTKPAISSPAPTHTTAK